MSEAATISNTTIPLTVESLAEQFAACGMTAGQTVVVHSSMSKLGYVVGGAEAVILALLTVLTPDGTLVMPTHTTENTDPGFWQEPPVPESWWTVIRQHTPAFNPLTTPTREMGRVPELFRTWPGVQRSHHPITSCAALGKYAAYLMESHPLEDEFGDESPFGKLYALDGSILLLGAGHGNNTSLHVAEARASWPGKHTFRDGCAMLVDGQREWVYFDRMQPDASDFERIGADYEAQYAVPVYKVGNADVRFIKQRPLVDFAVKWMESQRK
jgi:aminoglycoside 3-N-acetyltransferase